MLSNSYDVIVVGAGPAGCVAARFAAEAGASVLLLERKNEIGIPVHCGEGIKGDIDKLGVIQKGPWIANYVKGVKFFSPNNTQVTVANNRNADSFGYIIHRDIFDKELAALAANAGVKILLNAEAIALETTKKELSSVKVRLFNEVMTVKAKVIVGADGIDSRVGKWIGITTTLNPKDILTCAQYTFTNTNCDREYCEVYLGKHLAPGGYVWSFPKQNGTVNVGIGIYGDFHSSNRAKLLLDAFIASHKEYSRCMPVRFLAGAAPASKPVHMVKKNMLLVGDAAHVADPLSGGGILQALHCGKIAGMVIGEAIQRNCIDESFLKTYEKKYRSEFNNYHMRNYILKNFYRKLDDDQIDRLANSLKDYSFLNPSAIELINALIMRNSWVLPKMADIRMFF